MKDSGDRGGNLYRERDRRFVKARIFPPGMAESFRPPTNLQGFANRSRTCISFTILYGINGINGINAIQILYRFIVLHRTKAKLGIFINDDTTYDVTVSSKQW